MNGSTIGYFLRKLAKVKMSKGCVILANDTREFQYRQLAQLAAARVRNHLDLPCEIMSLEDLKDNHRVLQGMDGKLVWNNLGRTKIYELSPFDRTLVIDADYFITSSSLAPHLEANFDFAMIKDMHNPVTGEPFRPMMGHSKIQQLWATVMIFNKSNISAKIFAMAQHVLDHYLYYSKLYAFNSTPIRNDYAFTIACHLMGGYGQVDYSLRGYRMFNCDLNTEILQISHDNVLVGYHKEDGKQYVQRLKNVDVHLQHKKSLFGLIDV
jgi:hypothetical protein